jgi:hypothetical protein
VGRSETAGCGCGRPGSTRPPRRAWHRRAEEYAVEVACETLPHDAAVADRYDDGRFTEGARSRRRCQQWQQLPDLRDPLYLLHPATRERHRNGAHDERWRHLDHRRTLALAHNPAPCTPVGNSGTCTEPNVWTFNMDLSCHAPLRCFQPFGPELLDTSDGFAHSRLQPINMLTGSSNFVSQ